MIFHLYIQSDSNFCLNILSSTNFCLRGVNICIASDNRFTLYSQTCLKSPLKGLIKCGLVRQLV